MDKTKPDFYMVNFLRDDVLDEEGALVEEAPKVRGVVGVRLGEGVTDLLRKKLGALDRKVAA